MAVPLILYALGAIAAVLYLPGCTKRSSDAAQTPTPAMGKGPTKLNKATNNAGINAAKTPNPVEASTIGKGRRPIDKERWVEVQVDHETTYDASIDLTEVESKEYESQEDREPQPNTTTNSPLVEYTKISPNSTNPRNHAIDTITIHCMAGDLSIEVCGNVFTPTGGSSSNYGIGSDGRIGMYVEEKNRSWCSSSASNDHRAVTIEVANSAGEPDWPVSDTAYAALVDLVTDICKRNGIKKLLWQGDKDLIGQIEKQNMTVHRWFAKKACPGNYLYDLHYDIAEKVNKQL